MGSYANNKFGSLTLYLLKVKKKTIVLFILMLSLQDFQCLKIA